MNRLRFRTWNGNTMNYNIVVGKFGAFWVNPGSKNDGLDEDDNASLTPYNTKCIDETVIMEFTGVHDCNGRLIYEGDIVRDGLRIMQVIFKQEACQFWFIWKDDEGVNRHKPLTATCEYDVYYFSNDDIEVIGNIYQNYELLHKS